MSSEGAGGLPIGMVTDASASAEGLSAGQMLRAAREAQGLHVAALAVSLKVPVRKLELLEADAYDELPDAVFTRALASSVCRALKVDAKPILDKLPQTSSPRLDHEARQVGTPFRAPGDGPKPGVMDQINRPAALAVLALLLAAVVLIFLPDLAAQRSAPGPAASATQPAQPANGAGAVSMGAGTGLPAGASETVALSPSAAGASAASGVDTATLVITTSTVATSTPTVPSPTLVITPAMPPATSTGAAAAAGPVNDVPEGSLVVFKASGQTWVEVTDARGRNTLRRLLQAGDTVGAAGNAPLSVVVGRADVTQVSVRGQAFDLAPVSSKDLVARFKVN